MVTILRVLRVRADETMRHLAARVGIHEAALDRAERGQAWVAVKWREPLAAALGVPIDRILDSRGWPKLARRRRTEEVMTDGRQPSKS